MQGVGKRIYPLIITKTSQNHPSTDAMRPAPYGGGKVITPYGRRNRPVKPAYDELNDELNGTGLIVGLSMANN